MSFSPSLVLYCRDLDRTRSFYETLGLAFVAEKHGKGPEHFAADLGGFVIELYPAPFPDTPWKPPHQRETSRLVLPVEKMPPLMKALTALHAPMAGPKPSSIGATLLTADPDGREVLVIESPA